MDNYNEFDEVFESDIRPLQEDVKKVVGDVVIINDYSPVTDDGTGNEIADEVVNVSDDFIVIAVNQNYVFKQKYLTYKQDLVVVNRRTQIKYRVPSHYLSIV